MIPSAPESRSPAALLVAFGVVPDRRCRGLCTDELGDPAYWTAYDHFMIERERRVWRRRAALAAAQRWLAGSVRGLAALATVRSGGRPVQAHRAI